MLRHSRLISRMREGSPPRRWKATSCSHTDFCRKVCPAGTDGFVARTPEIVIGYVERHALDGSAHSGKAMCGVVRAFLLLVSEGLHFGGLGRLRAVDLSLAAC